MQQLTQPQHANLKRLGMRAKSFRFEEEEQLIQHHLDLGQQSNLTEMKVHFTEHFSLGLWLPLIPQLTQLTLLELSTEAPQGFLYLTPFFEMLADGCPSLEQLVLTQDARSTNINAVDPMDRHNNLKRIVIDCKAIHGDMPRFCQTFTKLESLHLKATKYDWEDIECLQRGSFKLVFTPKRFHIPAFLYHAIS